MKSTDRYTDLLLILIFFGVLALVCQGESTDWPQFRGPDGNGLAKPADLPSEFSLDDNQHIAWQVKLPGKGPSSPIVWDDRVLVTASSGRQQSEMYLIAFDAGNGKTIWKRMLYATGRTLSHPSSGNAAPTPATDGNSIVAFFSSNDLACFGWDGSLRWYRALGIDYPKVGNDVGMASSPIIVDGVVIVQAESQGDAFGLGIDLETGKNLWKVARPRAANWTSPTVWRKSDQADPIVLLQSASLLSAHDPHTGAIVWEYEGDFHPIASPVIAGNQIFVVDDGLTRLQIVDDESPEPVWNASKLSPGTASPVTDDTSIYSVNRSGVLHAADRETGEVQWKIRLNIAGPWATPAISGNRLYCFDTKGKAAVVQTTPTGRLLANPELGVAIKGSPAIAGNAIFVRSDELLIKIAN